MPPELQFEPNDRFTLLLDATAAGYWEWTTDGTLPVVSPLLLKLYGIEGENSVPLLERVRACGHPDDLERLDAMSVATRDTEQSFNGMLRIRRENDGAARILRVLGRSFTTSAGERRVMGTVVDATEEFATLESLHVAQRQLEDAEHLAGIGSWSWNIQTGAVQWSKETYRILHVPFDTTPSFDLVLALAVDDAHREQFMNHVKDTLTGGQPYDFEIDARRPDGTPVTIHTRGAVERDADGTALRMVGTMQDVTEIRQARRELEARESRFRTLAESSPMGIVLTDPRLVPTYANRRVLDWFNLTIEEYAAGLWRSRVHPDDLAQTVARLRANMHPPTAFLDRYRIVVDDTVRWLEVRTEPLTTSDGDFIGLVGTMLDISAEKFAAEERERLQAQLQQAQKLESLGLLAGGVAHDFNNLLVSILANASMARDDIPDTSATASMLADIEHAAQRAAELTRQLLEYGGRSRTTRRRVDLSALAGELPSLLRARIPRHVRLYVEGTNYGFVHGDETQLRQVLMNLVTNAVDAIGQRDGHVSVHIARERVSREALAKCLLGTDRDAGDYVVVTVTDSGHGIRAELIERIFDPFFTTKPDGRGLGLAATLGILNGHGGAISVQSVNGEGTSMRVLLPWSEYVAATGTVAREDDSVFLGTGTVLLVDDDAAVRMAARRALQRAGFDVIEAEDGVHALERYDEAQGRIECAVLDVSMPRMSGDVCLQALRARNAQLPILLSTGYDAADVVRDIVERGQAGFVQKPYTARTLLRAVRETLRTPAPSADDGVDATNDSQTRG